MTADVAPVALAGEQSAPTLAELKGRGLVELARYKVLGPGMSMPRSSTALRQVVLVGRRGTGGKFLPAEQYECLVDTGAAERALMCYPRQRLIHG